MGWKRQAYRHSLAAKGIKTKDLKKLDRISMDDYSGTVSLYFHPSHSEIQEQIDWTDDIVHNHNTKENIDIQSQLEEYFAEQELSLEEISIINKRLNLIYTPGDKIIQRSEILYVLTGKHFDFDSLHDDKPEIILKADHDHPDTYGDRGGEQTKISKIIKNELDE